MKQKTKIFISVVCFNNEQTIVQCLNSLFAIKGYRAGQNLHISVVDNASTDQTSKLVREHFSETQLSFTENKENLGFCQPHNKAAQHTLSEGYDYFLCLNPDASLEPDSLEKMVEAMEESPESGAVTPLIIRADDNLKRITPEVVDSAGIWFNKELRHFDRFQEKELSTLSLKAEYVFGGTGAALFLRKECLQDLQIVSSNSDLELFDPNFFAYREDADLAWRLSRLGWKTLFWPEATVLHQRKVTPDRRSILPDRINSLGVQNRFLLQLKNFSTRSNWHCFLKTSFRNLTVLGACLTVERSSLSGIKKAFLLASSCLEKRTLLEKHSRVPKDQLQDWFSDQPSAEPFIRKSPEAISYPLSIRAVVVGYRSQEIILSCLDSLKKCKTELSQNPDEKIDLEISVVDNGHALPELSEHDHSELEVIRPGRNLGFGPAVNLAASNSDCDAILILNPDLELEPESIQRLCESLFSSNMAAVAPILEDFQGNLESSFSLKRLPSLSSLVAELFFLHRLWPNNPFSSRLDLSKSQLIKNYLTGNKEGLPKFPANKAIPVEQPPAACFLIKSDIFDELLGFDPHFWPAWFEDVDTCARIKDLGLSCGLLSTAKCRHSGGYSLGTIGPADYYLAWFGNMARFAKKHFPSSQYSIFRISQIFGLTLRLPLSLNTFRKFGAGKALNQIVSILKLVLNPVEASTHFNPEEPELNSKGTESSRDWRRHFSNQLQGEGLELGPLHRPLQTHQGIKVSYVDRMSVSELREHYPELEELDLVEPDIIDDAEFLSSVKDSSQDFVIAAHIVEHLRNPFAAINEWCRVTKPSGLVYLIVPDGRYTFDKARPITSMEHLILDYNSPCEERDKEHFLEFSHLVSNNSGQNAVSEAHALIEKDYSIHFHVFDPLSMERSLKWLAEESGQFTIKEGPVKTPLSDEFHFILEVA